MTTIATTYWQVAGPHDHHYYRYYYHDHDYHDYHDYHYHYWRSACAILEAE